MTSDHYAKEARRLLDDETLKSAFSTVYQSALEALVNVKADDIVAISRHQAKALVIEEVLSELKAAILRVQKPAEQTVP